MDPEFWQHEQWKNSEIMDEFQVVAERILGVEQATKALSQWTSYINKECIFANANTFEKQKRCLVPRSGRCTGVLCLTCSGLQ